MHALKEPIDNSIDILLISETKIGNLFPTAQFYVNGYSSPYRLGRNSNGGGIFSHIRRGIPSKEYKVKLIDSYFEGIFRERTRTKLVVKNAESSSCIVVISTSPMQ